PSALGLNSELTMPSPHTGIVQLKLQVALLIPPVSHCSWVWLVASLTTLSPQNSMRQAPSGDVLPEQPSPLVLLPSSHCSPGSTRPLPHCWMWQSAAQVKPFGLPPEPKSLPSHSSPGSLTPLPQCSNRQRAEHPVATDGGSHCSTPSALGLNSELTMPSPHTGIVQLKLQVALLMPAVSHCSWVWVVASLTTLSPQNSMTQAPSGEVLPEQPSPLALLPSSHCSPGSTRPLPQVSNRQSKQPSPLALLPSCHCSP